MQKAEMIQKTTVIIEELPRLYRDFMIFRYVHGFNNRDIMNLLKISEENVWPIFLYAELKVRFVFEERENMEFRDKVVSAAVELAMRT